MNSALQSALLRGSCQLDGCQLSHADAVSALASHDDAVSALASHADAVSALAAQGEVAVDGLWNSADAAIVARFQQDCRVLGRMLRAIPMQSVGTEFLQGIRAEIQASSGKPDAETLQKSVSHSVSPDPGQVTSDQRSSIVRLQMPASRHTPQRSSTRPLAGMVSVAVTCLTFAILLRLSAQPESDTPPETVGINVRLNDETSLQRKFDSDGLILAQNSPTMNRYADPLVLNPHGDGILEGLDERLVLGRVTDDVDWEILVVQVASQDRAQVMAMLAEVANSTEMNIQTVPNSGQFQADSFGVLLTSAPARNQTFVDSVTQAPLVASSEWNPAAVGQMNRQQLIASVRQSMLNPTMSELHFGEVYLAVPRGTDAASALNFAAADSQTTPQQLPSDATDQPVIAAADAELQVPTGGVGIRNSNGRNQPSTQKGRQTDLATRREFDGLRAADATNQSQPPDRVVRDAQIARVATGRPVLVVFEFQPPEHSNALPL